MKHTMPINTHTHNTQNGQASGGRTQARPIKAVAAKAMRNSIGRLMGILILRKTGPSREVSQQTHTCTKRKTGALCHHFVLTRRNSENHRHECSLCISVFISRFFPLLSFRFTHRHNLKCPHPTHTHTHKSVHRERHTWTQLHAKTSSAGRQRWGHVGLNLHLGGLSDLIQFLPPPTSPISPPPPSLPLCNLLLLLLLLSVYVILSPKVSRHD